MRLRHVGGVGGGPAPHKTADVDGHALAAMEEFDGRRGQAGVDELLELHYECFVGRVAGNLRRRSPRWRM